MGQGVVIKNLAQCQGQSWPAPILFEGLNLNLALPSVHLIMGASGSGKSTLLRSIGGVWHPLRGEIFVEGQPLWVPPGPGLNPSISNKMGFAFQNNALFNSMSVSENLCFPHRTRYPNFGEKKRRDLALDWLQKVGLEKTALQMPFELSGGMQKRLAIARAMILEPDYLFLDDPTAGLDPISSRSMAQLVNSLLKGKRRLVIIVTNDPDRANDWGENIHFLHNKKVHSPNSAEYEEVRGIYL